jgi:peptidoglycan/LPS O-acetylase OafA/YrhL
MSAAWVKYRSDIDGLRALAVVPVVLFHFGLSWLPGGFAGVDVFFVISGYLITGIVKREIDEGRFSAAGFYERRARRIFPALFAMLAAVILAGLIIYTPDDLRDLGASVLATTTFCSNILFWLQTDYFAGPAELKPLVHTWSLAVEEQYYIVLPPLMWALSKFAPKRLVPTIIALTLVSFGLSCAWLFFDRSGDFYLPHTRAWELFAGSLLALGVVPEIQSSLWRQLLGLVGLLLVAAPFFLLNQATPFPGWSALPTCLGVALLIHTGRQGDTVSAKVLSATPLVWIGLLSYSIYLIHWPLIVFTRYQLLRDPNGLEIGELLVATLVLAWISWRFIEQPFRIRGRISRKWVFSFSAGIAAALVAFGGLAFATNGLPQILGRGVQVERANHGLNAPAENRMVALHCFVKAGWQPWPGEPCFLTKGRGPVTLFWGDSHSNHFTTSIEKNAALFEEPILYYGTAGCPPIFDIEITGRDYCRSNNGHAMEIIKRFGIKRIILAGYWQREMGDNHIGLDRVATTVKRLQGLGLSVAVIGDTPDYPFRNPTYLAARLLKRPNPSAPFYTAPKNDFGFNGRLRDAVGSAEFFDPLSRLCEGNRCLVFNDGQSMMADNMHLTASGAQYLIHDVAALANGSQSISVPEARTH